MIKNIIGELIGELIRDNIGLGGKWGNSIWSPDGTINCSGIIYCDQPIPVTSLCPDTQLEAHTEMADYG